VSKTRKVVYRDKATGRLITRQEAESRDSLTWAKEELLIVEDHGPFLYDEPEVKASGEE